jgi:broad specificity phosphatase PhoE
MPEKIFLLRHGQSVSNLDHTFGGWSDTPLTDLGIAQAKALKKRLGRERIEVAYCSDLVRTKQTIEHADLGCKIVFSKAIRERSYGDLEGTKWSDMKDPEKYHVDHLSRPPGGETPKEVQERVVKYFKNTIVKDKHEKVLIIGHHGSLILLTMHLLGMPLKNWRMLALGNAGLSILSWEEGNWRVRLWNSLSTLGLKTSGALFKK